ncbi:hypothetical protein HOY80DRAFT_941418, partial [Tuber brumale]
MEVAEKSMQETQLLRDEVTILCPLKHNAVTIRSRFFAVYARRENMHGIGNANAIHSGNDTAHARDVVVDICLFKHGLIKYEAAFAAIYGLKWQDAATLIDFRHMVTVLNKRATVLCKNTGKWMKQDDFEALVMWTRNASPKELAEFRTDEVGKTHGKRLYFSILLN